ncbi:unnamed protein product [Chironomus riparius]|uniref:Uncharacterized protein n=1 Tax=Chironomus riparius TaxID=315576 RepID=A0A9N9WVT0_9DIPT|nr:unnamed protein product [Chironomus riparius]
MITKVNVDHISDGTTATSSTAINSLHSDPNKNFCDKMSLSESIQSNPNEEISNIKKQLTLDLTHNLNSPENEDLSCKSPTSPKSARVLSHQSSLTSQVEVVDDRKALRDALYQGIFHRHRRTIFAIGSFLRMLKSRNSQYNSIRSSSEDENTR